MLSSRDWEAHRRALCPSWHEQPKLQCHSSSELEVEEVAEDEADCRRGTSRRKLATQGSRKSLSEAVAHCTVMDLVQYDYATSFLRKPQSWASKRNWQKSSHALAILERKGETPATQSGAWIRPPMPASRTLDAHRTPGSGVHSLCAAWMKAPRQCRILGHAQECSRPSTARVRGSEGGPQAAVQNAE